MAPPGILQSEMSSIAVLERLIAFPTVSRDSNLALIEFCAKLLEEVGADITIIRAPDAAKGNLYATIGPRDRPGVLLSGHTDVVPVDGQDWTVPPFEMTTLGTRLFGRGTADMKGFVACALHAAVKAAAMDLKTPLHLALSYDEEIGCVGVRSLIDMLAAAPQKPMFCIVGEPTQMQIATGHKGKTALKVEASGHAGHSALAPSALNAIHMACDVIAMLRDLQQRLAETAARDEAYDVPYTTVHVGQISGGIALNIVPDHAEFTFEIRNITQDDPAAFLAEIKDACAAYLGDIQTRFPEAAIRIDVTNSYPPLSTPQTDPVVGFVQSLVPAKTLCKVAFGTEGGLFSTHLGIPTVVCGPGAMDQGHKPDEFIETDQMHACDAMLDTLLMRLRDGV